MSRRHRRGEPARLRIGQLRLRRGSPRLRGDRGRLRSGTVAINGWRVVVPHAPYGGWRGSGLGTELGRAGLEAFCRWQHLRVLR